MKKLTATLPCSVFIALLLLTGCVSNPTAENIATAHGKAVKFYKAGDRTIYETWDIPQYVKPDPNLATLRHYLKKHLRDPVGFNTYLVKASEAPSSFTFEKKDSAFLKKQMQQSSLLSYLYYSDGKVVYDEKTPNSRFGDLYDDDTQYRSNSVGKSFVSYVLGHAICQGYIESVDTKINDWPLMADTLYHDLTLTELLNMRAQDQKYVHDSKGLLSSGRWYNVHSLESFANLELEGSKPSGDSSYHYNGLVTNVLMNYTIFKAGDQYQALLEKIFRDKVGVKNDVYFFKNRTIYEGSAWYMFYASRYDYLRIARAMLDDWKSDSCVGKYLKTVYKSRQPKLVGREEIRNKTSSSLSYAGQFLMDYMGMEDRKIIGMDGYGGQNILIDTERSNIVVVNTIHTDYDWYELVHQAIKNEKIRD
ncbi:hypothetical protein N9F12_02420 [Burkholderiaceae bacterium]|nr:hypothetical protein [Burkholderiaceae bacterium]